MQMLNEVFSLLHKNAAISVMIYVQINSHAFTFTSISYQLNCNSLTGIYSYSGCSLAILSTTGCVTPVEL